jgi:hypothetical protein
LLADENHIYPNYSLPSGVFDRRHHDQRPDHEREHAECDRWVGSAAGKTQNRLERVERARPDIAEDHPQGREAERRQARGVRRALYGVTRNVRQRANSGNRRGTSPGLSKTNLGKRVRSLFV